MSRPTKEFPTSSVLSVVTGYMLSERVGDLYEILNWMTGDNLFTHQLPRAFRECSPDLILQFPQFSNLPAGLSKETWKAWLDGMIEQHGHSFMVAKLPVSGHEFIDPMSEAAQMFRPEQIVQVKVPRSNS